MSWRLWLDDERPVPHGADFHHARSSEEAKRFVLQMGLPAFMHLDHDLGGDDTTMKFLRWLEELCAGECPPPAWTVHSANPVGAANIRSFLDAWNRDWQDS